MDELNKLNSIITDSINSGVYDFNIDLSNYSNIPNTTALIILPVWLDRIVFISQNPAQQYNFRLVVTEGRTKDIEIYLVNTFINSGENIAIDLRGDNVNNAYLNKIYFSGENNVQSSSNIGILLMNNQNLEIKGIEESSILNVRGGSGNSAIGNSEILNSGGHIVFSGQGNINAYGGNALNEYSYDTAMNGGNGIGFVENTLGSSSITIKCNAVVNTFGGNGQKCDVSNPNSKAVGNGGAGISLGTSGVLITEKCPNIMTNLIAVGGNGGAIADTNNDGWIGDMRSGGNGGNAVALSSGIVTLYGNADLRGGNGTTLELQKNLPVSGGNGGNAISFTEDIKARNTIIISGQSTLSGGNGGTSGVSVEFDQSSMKIASPNGGNGGHAIYLGSSQSNVQLYSSTLISGNGGQGGSPKAYLDYNNLKLSDLVTVSDTDKPGAGGANGSAIKGTGTTNLNISNDTTLNSGVPGMGGYGIQKNGDVVQGESGTISKEVDVETNPSPHFGYVNIRRFMNLQFNNSSVKYREREYGKSPITIKNLCISQSLDSCLNIDNITVLQYYNIYTPNKISANAFMDLIVNSKVNLYVKEAMPVVCKRKK